MHSFKLVVLLLATSATLCAQNLFVQYQGGYSLDLAPESFNAGSIFQVQPNVREFQSINHSFGRGWNSGILVGYRFNKVFSLQTELGFLESEPIVQQFEYYEFKEIRTFESNMWRVIPQIGLHIPFRKMQFYSKLGAVIGVKSKMLHTKSLYVRDIKTEQYQRLFGKGKSVGLFAALGASYPIFKKISLNGELRFISQSHSPKQSELIEANAYGRNRLKIKLPSEIYTQYEENYQVNEVAYRNSFEPKTALKFYLPYSSIGFNLGISLEL